MIGLYLRRRAGAALLIFSLLLVTAIYWPGLSGSWLFDDYPNIVDNHGVQPASASLASLLNAALSSPSSEFKRPLASLSFAANYLATGLNPFGWKLTNLLIHLLNGALVFWLTRTLLRSAAVGAHPVRETLPVDVCEGFLSGVAEKLSRTGCAPTVSSGHAGIVAALIAGGWMLLPINLTGVLYVVQRMESMANLFVLLGLVGYTSGRQRMREDSSRSGFVLCVSSFVLATSIGLLCKETAVMLPLYALLIEWTLFHFRNTTGRRDWRIIGSFLVLLILPMLIGLAWLLPGLLNPQAWATRDFTMGTRLLSEARIVVDYLRWTLLPTPDALSFYHDDFPVSTGLLAPASTLASLVFLCALAGFLPWLRARRPLTALGIALFLGCQLMTGTLLPLELIYEHRNYFASFGLMVALVPLLAAPARNPFLERTQPAHEELASVVGEHSLDHVAGVSRTGCAPTEIFGGMRWALPRYAVLTALILYWAALTAVTAYAWGDPLRLARDLAARAPSSPRAQYELGRTYIIYSKYDPASPFTRLAYAPLERAAALPGSSILPQQALIFMNSRMHLPLKDAWWDILTVKLQARPAGVQDESSLRALTQCAREGQCQLPSTRMKQAFEAALGHPDPAAALFAAYGDYAWNVLHDHVLGEQLTESAVLGKPSEPAYRITLVRMLAESGRRQDALKALGALRRLNTGGRLDHSLAELDALLASP